MRWAVRFSSFMGWWARLLLVISLCLAVHLCPVSGRPEISRVANQTRRLPGHIPVSGYGTMDAFPGMTFDQPIGLASPPGDTNRLFVVQRNGLICVITNLAAP